MPRTLIFSLILSLALPAIAEARAPTAPSLKPQRPYASKVVSTQDAAILHDALAAAESGDWSRIRRLQGEARAQIVKDLILWRRASSGPPGMGFDEISQAMTRLDNWPDTFRMRNRAEEIIDLSALSARKRIDWFAASPPKTGEGRIALARAWSELGETEKAAQMVREAWHGSTLDRTATNFVLARYGSLLTREDHERRVDFLLWTGQRSAANSLKPRLDADWRRLVEARIALQAGSRGVNSAIDAVPPHLLDHPGLLHDRAKWRRRRGRLDDAIPLLVGIDGAAVPPAGRHKLWDERNIALRSALKDRNFDTAYKLSAPHGLTEGVDFSEAEWTAGWVALRHQSDSLRASRHFASLAEGVSTPISNARADYWSGRAADALGDREAAKASYAAAAQHNYTYYGQLAAERIGERRLSFTAPPEPDATEIAAFEARPLVQALRLLGEAGEAGLFLKFAYHLDDQLSTPAEFALLKQLGDEYQHNGVGVRGAKSGLARGIVVPDAAYPLVEYPLLRDPQVERSLMLALSRQESEMNPRAISHANARGLMQFLPATARQEARLRGLPYRTSWLTDDPGYNMTLGGAHLDTLLARFNGSYIMAAAAYNAGASRPERWIEDYGDPRKGEVDVIDWVEFIPFSETRNYVQRVLENTQVYRHRLSGEEEVIRLSEDLERGRMR